MDREIELKFLIAPDAAGEVLRLLEGEDVVRQLNATYFDTADHALRKAGFGLRVRDGEGGRKQTLKSASAGGIFARGEWETPVAGPGPDPLALAATPAGAVVEGQALQPVFTTRVERIVRMVRRGEALIEAVVDRGELVGETRRAPVCELELELKAGEPAALFDLARDLGQRVPLRLSLVSKAERGYALADIEEAATGASRSPAHLTPDMSVGEALQAVGRAALSQLCATAEALRARPGPETVHQLRVAARRMRALLKAFRPLSSGPEAVSLDGELSWLAGELDAARALDVFIADVWRPAGADQPADAGAGFERALRAAQTSAYLRMEAALESRRGRALLLEAAAWLEAGAWTTAPDLAGVRDGAAPAFAAAMLQRRRHVLVKKGRRLDQLDPEARHRLRLKGKTMRYAATDLAGLFPEHPRRVERFLTATRRLQDMLGRLNDLRDRRALASEIARAVGDAGETLQLDGLAGDDDEAALLAEARKARDTFAEAKVFWCVAKSHKDIFMR